MDRTDTKQSTSMNYQELITKLKIPRTFNTLGAQSTFTASSEGDEIMITNSTGTAYPVKEELHATVLERYQALSPSAREVVKNFTDPEWEKCPDRIIPPYLAAIYKEFGV